MKIANSSQEINKVRNFITTILEKTGKDKVVIAISGGIDSALTLSLLAKSIQLNQIFPILLPYDQQLIADSQLICQHNHIPQSQIKNINIKTMVDSFTKQLAITDKLALGNIMARCRMITIYHIAKKLDALVCGTENKSEKYLGYFTRYGDEASDFEPIQHLYKTQVWQLAQFLKIPQPIIAKAPSAGLWAKQTDEAELGFSYQIADQVLVQYIDQKKKPSQIKIAGISQKEVEKVISRVVSQKFKLEVPYKIIKNSNGNL